MILWLVYIVLDAVVSWYLIEKRRVQINHLIATIVRLWMFVLIGITVPVTEQTLFCWVLFTTTSFWVIFDPLLNKLRGRSFFYVGQSAVIDKFGRRHPIVYWSLKGIALITAVTTALLLTK